MRNGAWFVIFPKERVPSEEHVRNTLNNVRGAVVTKIEEMAFTVSVGEASFGVTLNDKSWVVRESKEAVEDDGQSLTNRDAVKTYDARFELLFDHTDMGDLFAPLLTTAEKLAKLTDGVIYETDNNVFQ